MTEKTVSTLYLSRKVPTELIKAASLAQVAYERALNIKNQTIKDRALQLTPPLLKTLEELSPGFSQTEYNDFLVERFLFDDHGQPFPNSIERIDRFAEILVEFSKLKSSGSPEGKRMILELSSGMVPKQVQNYTHKKVDLYAPCTCGSERKYKFCCYEKHRAEVREKKAFPVGRY